MTIAAIEEAERLIHWIEPNAAVYSNPDLGIEDKLLDAGLGGPIPPDLATGITLLRFLDPTVEPQSLIEAVVFKMEKPTRTTNCEHCGSNAGGRYRLLVPMGTSVVAYHCCWFCRDLLTDYCGELVWD
jgi:hypothetical protein